MRDERLAILAGVRTPFAKAGTDLKDYHAEALGALAVNELLARTGVDAAIIDEVVIGSVGQTARAANVARVVALLAGISESVPAVTVHRNCASGFEALTVCLDRARAGRGGVFIAGGTESMSNYPLEYGEGMRRLFAKLFRAKSFGARLSALMGFRIRHLRPKIALEEGLRDPTCGLSMGETAEVLAREFSIGRDEQDKFAFESHRKATAARAKLREETMDVVVPGRTRKDSVLRNDNGVRTEQTLEALTKLRPYFDKQHGSVTVGNSCQVTDGAAVFLVASESRAAALGIPPIGYLADYAYAGLSPRRMGLGPAYAIARLLAATGHSLADFGLFEINEAFAAQVLASLKALGDERFCREELHLDAPIGRVPSDKLNVQGGAIALGHPVGASGARLCLSLLLNMNRHGVDQGLAALCVGGGQGGALLFQRN